VDEQTARAEMPLTEVDRLHGEYRVALLRNDWPFVAERRPTQLPAPANRIEEIAQSWFAGGVNWAEAMNEALAEYQRTGNNAEAARVAVNLADAFISSAQAQYTAGRQLLQADQAPRALRYLRRATGLDDGVIEYQLSLAQAQFMLGRKSESVTTLEAILAKHPDDTRAKYWLAQMGGPPATH
jgi:predicted Zn-dependent protease